MKKYPNMCRAIVFLLVLAMLLPTISMTVFSQDIPCVEDGCSGKYRNGICSEAGHYEAAPLEEGVYKISNAGQLYWFAALVNGGEVDADAALTADITINADMEAEDKLAWTPIGLYTSGREFVSYAGTFDGNGKTIYGLYYDNTNYDGRNAGLFGTLAAEGTVKDLAMADSVINGATEIGGIVSYNYGSIINCAQLGFVTGTGATGGIACRNLGLIKDCANIGSVSGSTTGGIAAENNGEIIGCENGGAVSGTNSVGGIVGMNDGSVQDSLNAAKVTASGTHVGGVVGNHVGGEIVGSGNTGDVTGASDYIGGVAGVCSGATITESFNTGDVTGNASKSEAVGGVVGAIDGTNTDKAVITSCYNTGEVSGRSWVGGIAGVSGYQKTPMTVEFGNSYTTGIIVGSSRYGAVVGSLTKGTVSGTYFLEGVSQNSISGATEATAEQFASGEIAVKLNEVSNVWYQALDLVGMEPDASPVLDATHGAVYAGYCNCTEWGYTNRENYDEPGYHVDADGNNVCDICGHTDGEVHEHVFGDEWTVTKEPTCSEVGLEERVCTECGWAQKREIPKADHTEEVIPGTPATLNETGLSDGKKCSVCDEILVAQEIIPVLDYNDGIIPLNVLKVSAGDWERNGGASEGPAELAVDDDFNTLWHTDWKGTSRANHWFQFEITEDYIVDGLRIKPREGGSTNGIITEYDIQVSNDGVTFRSVTSGNWAGDSTWKVAEFEGEQVKFVRLVAVNALTDNSWVFASAAEIRLTGYKPGEEPHEHNWSDWAVTTPATCTEDGVETRSCSCGESETRVIPALGHNYEDGTCTNCGEKEPVTNPFIDVPEGIFLEPVLWAVEKGITTGTSETTFDPLGQCGRATVVIFLWRAAGSPEPTATVSPFTDVSINDWYAPAVLWAVEKGITTGTSATTFSPFEVCNRTTVVTFLWRYMGEPEAETACGFSDVPAGAWFEAPINWAVEEGITNGIGNNLFDVLGVCNRVQVVTFLHRLMAK